MKKKKNLGFISCKSGIFTIFASVFNKKKTHEGFID